MPNHVRSLSIEEIEACAADFKEETMQIGSQTFVPIGEVDALRAERDRLREALKEAIDAIQVFHGPGWEIYRDNSPEMKRWKALLGAKP